MDIIEPFTPYAECLMWRLHRAYYQQRGVQVWTHQEIPSIATSNMAHARLHVRALQAVAAPAPAPIVVLELGGGSGEFATSFLTALSEADPALAARTRYLLSDMSSDTLAAAARLPSVKRWIDSGHLLTARLDLSHPEALALSSPATMVLANYVCCALPMRPLDKDGDVWSEPWVETRAELDGGDPSAFVAALLADGDARGRQGKLVPVYAWRSIDLETALGPELARVVRRATSGFERARVLLPELYFRFMRTFAERLAPGGLFVTSDYGYVEPDRLVEMAERDGLTERFADSLGQEVQFVLFDALAAELGWSVARTRDQLDELHVALLGPTGLPAAARTALAERLWGRMESGQLLDFREAARVLESEGDNARALRFWLRCIAIDARWVEARERAGLLAIEVGQLELARDQAQYGRDLAPELSLWDHIEGEIALAEGDDERARIHWVQAFLQEPRVITAAALARQALLGDDLGSAFRWVEQGLELSPDDATLVDLMGEIHDRTWQGAKALYRNEAATAQTLDIDIDDIVIE